ncbi:tetratricopeptide repeat protein [Amycolatopsis sp. NPDC021455]|uniref:tetratricopeptide repeat protein n=1 Tax=Amycolatopsis sp. NPDC021455 TaxID=3154901 RepID=UPI0033DF6425
MEQLTRVFEDAAVASAIIESLHDNGIEIRGSIEALPRGYSGARLVKAVLADVPGPARPRWCVIKYCPSAQSSQRWESRRHIAALRDSPPEFRDQHLVEPAFAPVRCPDGALVVGQLMANGDPLGAVDVDHLAEACKVVWAKVLEEWAGLRYDYEPSTVAALLRSELDDSFRAGGWLREWAQGNGLLEHAFLKLRDEKHLLPNPWHIFADESSAPVAEIHCLVGRTHGDLHGDNILVPVDNGQVQAAEFRLIDLATYEAQAPLSRDLATLLVSLCWREIGAASERSRSAFLAYLERDHRDERLDDAMPGDVRKIIDALREPAVEFAKRNNWNPVYWHQQLRVSLLAQAMLHSAYTSGTAQARRWCSRLACRLTRVLLGPKVPSTGLAMDFDAGKVIGAPENRRHTGDESVFIDRTGQRRRLRAALEDQVTAIVVISGPSGIGKTALVRETLAELGRLDPDDETSSVRWHDIGRYGQVDVPTLVEDIEPPGLGQIAGPSARARLELALDGLDRSGGVRPVIVLDAAENLLGDGQVLRDSELDLALEAVQGRLRPSVKVVFVTQQVPRAATGVSWVGTACRIGLEGLEPLSVREHFARLDPGNRHGLAALPEDQLRTVYSRLDGNPRLAELLHAVLGADPPGVPAHEAGAWLSAMPASEVHWSLTNRLIDQLPAEQSLVAKGLAALGVPVRTDAVVTVLGPYLPAARVEPALRALVAARLVLVYRDGRWGVRKSELEAILGYSGEESPGRQSLLVRAAGVLETMQKDDDDVHGMADLDIHFARIEVWLRAGLHDIAHSVIDATDELVRVWSSGMELRVQREAVRGRLGDDREGEMMNLAALGKIYSSGGDTRSALPAYESALTIAKQDQDREALRRIYIGIGTMFRDQDRLTEAEENYRWALALASEDDDDGGGDRAAALIGLADCRRRFGRYGRALADAREAYEAAWQSAPRLALDVALRLTRWYAELGSFPDALTMLGRCGELVLARPHPSAQAELLTSTADLHLYEGRYHEARSAAGQAVELARDHRLPAELRRSLTTLALAHVHLDDFPAAHRAIEEMARYRLAGRDTVELALRAIIAHRCRLPGTARDLFRQLREETSGRTRADSGDLPAWDFTGIARCHSVLLGEMAPEAALEAFARARPEPAERTPGLDGRVRFMVETLADGDPRLEPVLRGLARIRPGRTG